MDGRSHFQGTQGVTLKASYPPTLPHHLCDWIVTTVTGGTVTGGVPVDTLEYAWEFDSLPFRIETISMLNTLVFQYLVNALIVLWLAGLCLRSKKFTVRRAADEMGMTWLKELVDGVVLLTCVIFAGDQSLKSFVALYAFWAALGGGLLDSVGMLFVFALVFNNQMVPGIGLSVAYVTWAVILNRLPWRSSRLPNYKDFLANLRPSDDMARKQRRIGDEEEEEEEEGNCLVCWSSDDVPLELPCKRDHLICSDCLARLHESHRYQCPICRLPLYEIRNIKTALLELIVATLGAVFALTFVDIAVDTYNGSYLSAAHSIFIGMPVKMITWRHFRTSSAADEGYLASWRTKTLAFYALYLVVSACRLGHLLGEGDEATFIDGAFVAGVKMSTEVKFNRGGG